MKPNPFAPLIAAALGLAAFVTEGHAKKDPMAGTVFPSVTLAVMVAVTPPRPVPVNTAVAAEPDAAAARWSEIKDYNYDARAQFFEGFKRLEARLDGQIAELVAKRATMKGTTDTKAWDFRMKEMGEARSYLKSMGEELGKAPAETWDQQKDKVGLAWLRAQEAYRQVKASTTS